MEVETQKDAGILRSDPGLAARDEVHGGKEQAPVRAGYSLGTCGHTVPGDRLQFRGGLRTASAVLQGTVVMGACSEAGVYPGLKAFYWEP